MHLHRFLPLLLGLVLTGSVSCGDLRSDPDAERRAAAQTSIDQISETLRDRITLTCERWQDALEECNSERVYEDVLDCWTESGMPHLKAALEKGTRRRARERRVMLHHSLCMEERGWRLVPGSGGYF
jgi:hypothetical protein